MRIVIPPTLLLGSFLCGPNLGQSFVLPGNAVSHARGSSRTASSSTLYSILTLEDDWDDDENKNNINNQNNNVNLNNDGDLRDPQQQQQSLSDNDGAVSSLIQELQTRQQQATTVRPLTAMKRARLEKEISLLQELVEGDAVALELSHLWVNERGPDGGRALKVIEMLLDQGAYGQAEKLLIPLIQGQDNDNDTTSAVTWVAPIQLLASSCYEQGRMEQAKELYELVLEQKPWHLGALQGMHNACDALGDYKGLAQWDAEQLPPMRGYIELRQKWVDRMVAKAQAKLAQAEQGLQSFFDSGFHQVGSDSTVLLDDGFGDAWQ